MDRIAESKTPGFVRVAASLPILMVASVLLGAGCSKKDDTASAAGPSGVNATGGGAGASGAGGGSGGSSAGSGGSAAGGKGGAAGGTGGAGGSSGGAGGGTAGSGGNVAAVPCTLSLVKTLALPKPVVAKPKLFGPGLVATSNGFLVGYHEAAGDGSDDTLVLVPITTDGTVGTTATAKLSACFGTYAASGPGMTARGGAGLAAIPRPACKDKDGDTGGSLSLVQFGAGGDVQDIFLLKGPVGFPELTLPSHHALAPVPGTANIRVSYLQSGTAYGFDVSGVTVKSAFDKFAGSASDPALSFAAASSPNMLLQAAATGSDLVVRVAGPMVPGTPKLFKVEKGTDVATTTTPSGVVLASRVAPGTVRLDLVDEQGNLVAQSSIATKSIAGFDVAPVSKAVAIAVGDAGALSVSVASEPEAGVLPGMSSTLSVDAAMLTGFDGKSLAAAGTSGRVLVSWITKQDGDAAQAVGGAALFECK